MTEEGRDGWAIWRWGVVAKGELLLKVGGRLGKTAVAAFSGDGWRGAVVGNREALGGKVGLKGVGRNAAVEVIEDVAGVDGVGVGIPQDGLGGDRRARLHSARGNGSDDAF